MIGNGLRPSFALLQGATAIEVAGIADDDPALARPDAASLPLASSGVLVGDLAAIGALPPANSLELPSPSSLALSGLRAPVAAEDRAATEAPFRAADAAAGRGRDAGPAALAPRAGETRAIPVPLPPERSSCSTGEGPAVADASMAHRAEAEVLSVLAGQDGSPTPSRSNPRPVSGARSAAASQPVPASALPAAGSGEPSSPRASERVLDPPGVDARAVDGGRAAAVDTPSAPRSARDTGSSTRSPGEEPSRQPAPRAGEGAPPSTTASLPEGRATRGAGPAAGGTTISRDRDAADTDVADAGTSDLRGLAARTTFGRHPAADRPAAVAEADPGDPARRPFAGAEPRSDPPGLPPEPDRSVSPQDPRPTAGPAPGGSGGSEGRLDPPARGRAIDDRRFEAEAQPQSPDRGRPESSVPDPVALGPRQGAVPAALSDGTGTALSKALEALAGSSWSGSAEGIIPSLVFNAAIIPGWPPPHPFATSLSEALTGPPAPKRPDDAELAQRLIERGGEAFDDILGRLPQKLSRRRRRRLLSVMTAMMDVIDAVLSAVEQELLDAARRAAEAENEIDEIGLRRLLTA